MPVRIYEIARKLGVENKVVLAKAKELGIAGARVPSSTLDKITAEYLEEQMGYHPAPAAPAEPPAQAESAIAVISAPPPESAPPDTGPSPAPEPSAPPSPPPIAPLPELKPAPAPQIEIIREPPPAPIPEAAPPAPVEAEAPSEEPTPTTAAPEVSTPEAPIEVAPPGDEPVLPVEESAPAAAEAETPPPQAEPSPVAKVAPASPTPPPATAIPPSPPPPPPKPTEPPPPKIGDKVGFIQLPTVRRPAERPVSRNAGRQQQARADSGRGRDGRPDGRGGRGGPPTNGRGGREREPARTGPTSPEEATGEEIVMKPPVVVRDLAERMGRKPFQLIADLMEIGVFATVNQSVEPDIAKRVCAKHNFRFRIEKREKGGGLVHAPVRVVEPFDAEDSIDQLQPRAPVVTIMGHVDHGKTTLLDVIRKSNVAAGEAGGITQHIGAYTISIPHPDRPDALQQITFLDTPGHAAFSSMRARGANVTDIVVLVVAANDGMMPQTIEALNHAQAAHVPIIVAVNKCDHPAANPMRVRQQLQDKGLVPDDWGGDTIYVDVSALSKQGVDKLLEMLVLQAEMLNLKANPNRRAKGNVIESGLEPGGPTATVLVRTGTLRISENVVCGPYSGRVRALVNEDGKRLKEAGPSVAVKVLGLNGVPEAGEEFQVVANERAAREICEIRAEEAKAQDKEIRPKITLDRIFEALREDAAKVLKVVVKADTQGSVEAIVDALKKAESPKVSLEVIHSAVGTITESDVVLASASKAIVLGFHTRVDGAASETAKREGVQIKLYAIIYELIDEVRQAMAGLLDPLLKEVVFGSAEVRKVFSLSKGGNVAGCVVTDGRIVRGKARVQRRKNVLFEGIIHTLRRYQDEVNEVRAGMECGILLDGFDAFEEGDAIECYTVEKIAQSL